jgi:hypothetical protein
LAVVDHTPREAVDEDHQAVTITKHFSERFAGRPLAERPEIFDRLFDRPDVDKAGSSTLEEFKALRPLLRGGRIESRLSSSAPSS